MANVNKSIENWNYIQTQNTHRYRIGIIFAMFHCALSVQKNHRLRCVMFWDAPVCFLLFMFSGFSVECAEISIHIILQPLCSTGYRMSSVHRRMHNNFNHVFIKPQTKYKMISNIYVGILM